MASTPPGVDAIAARTGVTKRTLYQHFPGKDALVAEALADRSAEWRGGFEAAISRGANDPAGQLLAMFEVIGQRAAKPDFRGCEFVNAAADLPDRHHPARAVASHHERAVLDLIAQRVAQLGADPDGLARQLKLLGGPHRLRPHRHRGPRAGCRDRRHLGRGHPGATLSAAELLDYLGQVTDRLLQTLDGMPTEILHAPAPGLGGTAAATPG